MKELLRIKSKARTNEGIKKALEAHTDFLYDMTEEEKLDYINGALAEGSLEADGESIKIFCL